MSAKMKSDDPCYWMLFDGVETVPVVHKWDCYICRDPEFAQMGLPLCRACPVCGGHIAADDTRCDTCGLCEQTYWEGIRDCLPMAELEKWCFLGEDYESVTPGWLQSGMLRMAVLFERVGYLVGKEA